VTECVLDDAQATAVTIDPDRRQIVLAGPGAGKTQVVSALVENLVLDGQVDPLHGLVVLSFSNAAVHAVDARLRARNVPPVTVRTIDSLAARIVGEAGDEDLSGMGFDARIERATRLIREAEWADCEELEHVVIDEVQDVVGPRADFAVALLSALPDDAGFTLLGDPAQAIYDFQLLSVDENPPASTTNSAALLEAARRLGASTVALTGQYRAQTRDAVGAAALRPASGERPNPNDVDDFWDEVVHVGDVDSVVGHLRRTQGSVALLTDTNGQAMLTAGELRRRGIEVEVRRSARQRVLVSWIASTLADVESSSLEMKDFARLLGECDVDLDGGDAWRALRHAAGTKGRELDIPSLTARLRARDVVPPDLVDQPRGRATVSTIHRAKGLEYDDVVLMEFPSRRHQTEDLEERSRVRFVALTRARRILMRADGPDDRSLRKVWAPGASGARWIEGGWEKWQARSFEMRIDDVDVSCPPGNDPDEIQQLLGSGKVVGAEVTLRPDPRLSNLTTPVFAVLMGSTEVARTSHQFGVDLAARIGSLKRKRRGWPSLSGGYVECVATAVGERTGNGAGRNGLWLIPVISGLLTIEWSDLDD
jgi:DNA helicase-2/ATP-dependent DNA helicase PcrA